MKWLMELMESSHSSLEVLPVPCLCEFLMASYKEQRGPGASEMETDSSSHRAHYKRRRTAHDKVRRGEGSGGGEEGGEGEREGGKEGERERERERREREKEREGRRGRGREWERREATLYLRRI